MIETTLLGDWLPDLPYLSNPGLVEAKNCLPIEGGYKDFLALSTSDDALTEVPLSAYATIDDAGDPEIYVGTQESLFEKNGSSWTDRSGATTYTTAVDGYWSFCQFDSLVIATNYAEVPKCKTIGAAANFATLATTGTAPRGRHCGVIRRFLFLGDIDNGTAYPFAVAWSAIDDPRVWETPGTSAALAVQSGIQYLDSSYGAVTGIVGGEFFGLVFQERAITRFTYIGGDVVWQVDTYERSRGCWAPRSIVTVGALTYFIAADGLYVTDGQTVTPIGNGKADKWFFSSFDQANINRVTAGVDWINKCVYWAYPTSSATSGYTDRFITYSLSSGRFTWAETAVQFIFNSYSQGYTLDQLDSLFTSIDDMTISLDSALWQGGVPTIMGFSADTLGTFSGEALTAVFETGEVDGNPAGTVFVSGVRPLVSGDPTSITVALSARDNQDNAGRAFGSAVTRTSRTGVCDFRVNGRFISSRMTIAGGFDRAMGMQFDAEPNDGI